MQKLYKSVCMSSPQKAHLAVAALLEHLLHAVWLLPALRLSLVLLSARSASRLEHAIADVVRFITKGKLNNTKFSLPVLSM
jgi:hypothetical protein